MRRILVQCWKKVKDADFHSYRFRSSLFASCQSKICSGSDGNLTVFSHNSVSCQAVIKAIGLLKKKQGANLLLRVSCAGMGSSPQAKASKSRWNRFRQKFVGNRFDPILTYSYLTLVSTRCSVLPGFAPAGEALLLRQKAPKPVTPRLASWERTDANLKRTGQLAPLKQGPPGH